MRTHNSTIRTDLASIKKNVHLINNVYLPNERYEHSTPLEIKHKDKQRSF